MSNASSSTDVGESIEPLLSISDVNAFYGESQALFDVSVEVGDNEVVGIFGRNGMGKTTLLRSIVNQTVQSTGTITFRGQNISNWKGSRIVRNGIAFVPEERAVYPNLTVEENLRLASPRDISKSEFQDRLNGIYERFERLDERRTQKGGTLSGGEQQMLAIARGLITEPDLLLLDEPTEGLAPVIIEDVVDIIKDLSQEDRSVVLVEQSINRTLPLIDRGYILENGRVVVDAGPDRLADESLQDEYLTV
ncbi:ABC transporter ATP-binding protein [Saliphagus sp. GCM10025334]